MYGLTLVSDIYMYVDGPYSVRLLYRRTTPTCTWSRGYKYYGSIPYFADIYSCPSIHHSSSLVKVNRTNTRIHEFKHSISRSINAMQRMDGY